MVLRCTSTRQALGSRTSPIGFQDLRRFKAPLGFALVKRLHCCCRGCHLRKKNMFITSTKHVLSSSKHDRGSFEHVLSFATCKSSWKYLQKTSSKHWKGYMDNLLFANYITVHCSPLFSGPSSIFDAGQDDLERAEAEAETKLPKRRQNEEIFLWLSNIFHMFPSCSVLFHHFFADFPICSTCFQYFRNGTAGGLRKGSAAGRLAAAAWRGWRWSTAAGGDCAAGIGGSASKVELELLLSGNLTYSFH